MKVVGRWCRRCRAIMRFGILKGRVHGDEVVPSDYHAEESHNHNGNKACGVTILF